MASSYDAVFQSGKTSPDLPKILSLCEVLFARADEEWRCEFKANPNLTSPEDSKLYIFLEHQAHSPLLRVDTNGFETTLASLRQQISSSIPGDFGEFSFISAKGVPISIAEEESGLCRDLFPVALGIPTCWPEPLSRRLIQVEEEIGPEMAKRCPVLFIRFQDPDVWMKAALCNAPDTNGRTLLHVACERNSAESVKILLSKGASPLAVDFRGHTPLHLACELGHTECVIELLQFEKNLEKSTKENWEQEKKKKLKELKQSRKKGGPAIDENDVIPPLPDLLFASQLVDCMGRNCLHLALFHKFYYVAILLMDHDHGASLAVADSKGVMPSQLLAKARPFEASDVIRAKSRQELAKKGVEAVMVRCGFDFDKLLKKSFSKLGLRWGRAQPHDEVVAILDCLLEYHVFHPSDLCYLDIMGRSFVSDCIEAKNMSMFKYIISFLKKSSSRNGSNSRSWKAFNEDQAFFVALKDSRQQSPLHLAASKGHVDFVKLLAQTAPELMFEVDMHGKTPLHVALEMKRKDVAWALLALKPPLDVFDHDGNTPVHLTALLGFSDLLQSMLKSNPSLSTAQIKINSEKIHEIPHGFKFSTNRDPIMIRLLEKKQQIRKAQTSSAMSPVMERMQKMDEDFLEKLKSGKVKVMLTTPLGCAILGRSLECVNMLLNKGKHDIDAAQVWGQHPISFCFKNNLWDIACALLSHVDASAYSLPTSVLDDIAKLPEIAPPIPNRLRATLRPGVAYPSSAKSWPDHADRARISGSAFIQYLAARVSSLNLPKLLDPEYILVSCVIHGNAELLSSLIKHPSFPAVSLSAQSLSTLSQAKPQSGAALELLLQFSSLAALPSSPNLADCVYSLVFNGAFRCAMSFLLLPVFPSSPELFDRLVYAFYKRPMVESPEATTKAKAGTKKGEKYRFLPIFKDTQSVEKLVFAILSKDPWFASRHTPFILSLISRLRLVSFVDVVIRNMSHIPSVQPIISTLCELAQWEALLKLMFAAAASEITTFPYQAVVVHSLYNFDGSDGCKLLISACISKCGLFRPLICPRASLPRKKYFPGLSFSSAPAHSKLRTTPLLDPLFDFFYKTIAIANRGRLLHGACQSGHAELVDLAFRSRAFKYEDLLGSGCSPLFAAATSCDGAPIMDILAQNGATWNDNAECMRAFELVTKTNNLPTLALLVAHNLMPSDFIAGNQKIYLTAGGNFMAVDTSPFAFVLARGSVDAVKLIMPKFSEFKNQAFALETFKGSPQTISHAHIALLRSRIPPKSHSDWQHIVLQIIAETPTSELTRLFPHDDVTMSAVSMAASHHNAQFLNAILEKLAGETENRHLVQIMGGDSEYTFSVTRNAILGLAKLRQWEKLLKFLPFQIPSNSGDPFNKILVVTLRHALANFDGSQACKMLISKCVCFDHHQVVLPNVYIVHPEKRHFVGTTVQGEKTVWHQVPAIRLRSLLSSSNNPLDNEALAFYHKSRLLCGSPRFAFHQACRVGHKEFVELVLSAGENDLTALANAFPLHSPLFYATQAPNSVEIANILCAAGAKWKNDEEALEAIKLIILNDNLPLLTILMSNNLVPSSVTTSCSPYHVIGKFRNIGKSKLAHATALSYALTFGSVGAAKLFVGQLENYAASLLQVAARSNFYTSSWDGDSAPFFSHLHLALIRPLPPSHKTENSAEELAANDSLSATIARFSSTPEQRDWNSVVLGLIEKTTMHPICLNIPKINTNALFLAAKNPNPLFLKAILEKADAEIFDWKHCFKWPEIEYRAGIKNRRAFLDVFIPRFCELRRWDVLLAEVPTPNRFVSIQKETRNMVASIVRHSLAHFDGSQSCKALIAKCLCVSNSKNSLPNQFVPYHLEKLHFNTSTRRTRNPIKTNEFYSCVASLIDRPVPIIAACQQGFGEFVELAFSDGAAFEVNYFASQEDKNNHSLVYYAATARTPRAIESFQNDPLLFMWKSNVERFAALKHLLQRNDDTSLKILEKLFDSDRSSTQVVELERSDWTIKGSSENLIGEKSTSTKQKKKSNGEILLEHVSSLAAVLAQGSPKAAKLALDKLYERCSWATFSFKRCPSFDHRLRLFQIALLRSTPPTAAATADSDLWLSTLLRLIRSASAHELLSPMLNENWTALHYVAARHSYASQLLPVMVEQILSEYGRDVRPLLAVGNTNLVRVACANRAAVEYLPKLATLFPQEFFSSSDSKPSALRPFSSIIRLHSDNLSLFQTVLANCSQNASPENLLSLLLECLHLGASAHSRHVISTHFSTDSQPNLELLGQKESVEKITVALLSSPKAASAGLDLVLPLYEKAGVFIQDSHSDFAGLVFRCALKGADSLLCRLLDLCPSALIPHTSPTDGLNVFMAVRKCPKSCAKLVDIARSHCSDLTSLLSAQDPNSKLNAWGHAKYLGFPQVSFVLKMLLSAPVCDWPAEMQMEAVLETDREKFEKRQNSLAGVNVSSSTKDRQMIVNVEGPSGTKVPVDLWPLATAFHLIQSNCTVAATEYLRDVYLPSKRSLMESTGHELNLESQFCPFTPTRLWAIVTDLLSSKEIVGREAFDFLLSVSNGCQRSAEAEAEGETQKEALRMAVKLGREDMAISLLSHFRTLEYGVLLRAIEIGLDKFVAHVLSMPVRSLSDTSVSLQGPFHLSDAHLNRLVDAAMGCYRVDSLRALAKFYPRLSGLLAAVDALRPLVPNNIDKIDEVSQVILDLSYPFLPHVQSKPHHGDRASLPSFLKHGHCAPDFPAIDIPPTSASDFPLPIWAQSVKTFEVEGAGDWLARIFEMSLCGIAECVQESGISIRLPPLIFSHLSPALQQKFVSQDCMSSLLSENAENWVLECVKNPASSLQDWANSESPQKSFQIFQYLSFFVSRIHTFLKTISEFGQNDFGGKCGLLILEEPLRWNAEKGEFELNVVEPRISVSGERGFVYSSVFNGSCPEIYHQVSSFIQTATLKRKDAHFDSQISNMQEQLQSVVNKILENSDPHSQTGPLDLNPQLQNLAMFLGNQPKSTAFTYFPFEKNLAELFSLDQDISQGSSSPNSSISVHIDLSQINQQPTELDTLKSKQKLASHNTFEIYRDLLFPVFALCFKNQECRREFLSKVAEIEFVPVPTTLFEATTQYNQEHKRLSFFVPQADHLLTSHKLPPIGPSQPYNSICSDLESFPTKEDIIKTLNDIHNAQQQFEDKLSKLTDCHFDPTINHPRPKYQHSGPSIYERGRMSQQRRQQMQYQASEREMDGCTFKPNIRGTNKIPSSRGFSSFKPNGANKRGFSSFRPMHSGPRVGMSGLTHCSCSAFVGACIAHKKIESKCKQLLKDMEGRLHNVVQMCEGHGYGKTLESLNFEKMLSIEPETIACKLSMLDSFVQIPSSAFSPTSRPWHEFLDESSFENLHSILMNFRKIASRKLGVTLENESENGMSVENSSQHDKNGILDDFSEMPPEFFEEISMEKREKIVDGKIEKLSQHLESVLIQVVKGPVHLALPSQPALAIECLSSSPLNAIFSSAQLQKNYFEMLLQQENSLLSSENLDTAKISLSIDVASLSPPHLSTSLRISNKIRLLNLKQTLVDLLHPIFEINNKNAFCQKRFLECVQEVKIICVENGIVDTRLEFKPEQKQLCFYVPITGKMAVSDLPAVDMDAPTEVDIHEMALDITQPKIEERLVKVDKTSINFCQVLDKFAQSNTYKYGQVRREAIAMLPSFTGARQDLMSNFQWVHEALLDLYQSERTKRALGSVPFKSQFCFDADSVASALGCADSFSPVVSYFATLTSTVIHEWCNIFDSSHAYKVSDFITALKKVISTKFMKHESMSKFELNEWQNGGGDTQSETSETSTSDKSQESLGNNDPDMEQNQTESNPNAVFENIGKEEQEFDLDLEISKCSASLQTALTKMFFMLVDTPFPTLGLPPKPNNSEILDGLIPTISLSSPQFEQNHFDLTNGLLFYSGGKSDLSKLFSHDSGHGVGLSENSSQDNLLSPQSNLIKFTFDLTSVPGERVTETKKILVGSSQILRDLILYPLFRLCSQSVAILEHVLNLVGEICVVPCFDSLRAQLALDKDKRKLTFMVPDLSALHQNYENLIKDMNSGRSMFEPYVTMFGSTISTTEKLHDIKRLLENTLAEADLNDLLSNLHTRANDFKTAYGNHMNTRWKKFAQTKAKEASVHSGFEGLRKRIFNSLHSDYTNLKLVYEQEIHRRAVQEFGFSQEFSLQPDTIATVLGLHSLFAPPWETQQPFWHEFLPPSFIPSCFSTIQTAKHSVSKLFADYGSSNTSESDQKLDPDVSLDQSQAANQGGEGLITTATKSDDLTMFLSFLDEVERFDLLAPDAEHFEMFGMCIDKLFPKVLESCSWNQDRSLLCNVLNNLPQVESKIKDIIFDKNLLLHANAVFVSSALGALPVDSMPSDEKFLIKQTVANVVRKIQEKSNSTLSTPRAVRMAQHPVPTYHVAPHNMTKLLLGVSLRFKSLLGIQSGSEGQKPSIFMPVLMPVLCSVAWEVDKLGTELKQDLLEKCTLLLEQKLL